MEGVEGGMRKLRESKDGEEVEQCEDGDKGAKTGRDSSKVTSLLMNKCLEDG